MTSPTLKERAKAHANLGVGTQAIRERSFLEGARAALEMGAEWCDANEMATIGRESKRTHGNYMPIPASVGHGATHPGNGYAIQLRLMIPE